MIYIICDESRCSRLVDSDETICGVCLDKKLQEEYDRGFKEGQEASEDKK